MLAQGIDPKIKTTSNVKLPQEQVPIMIKGRSKRSELKTSHWTPGSEGCTKVQHRNVKRKVGISVQDGAVTDSGALANSSGQ